ncbi:hypothetical protein D3C73_709950 [compost metagenome]
MIFHLDGQPLVRRVERGAAGHRPGFEDTIKLQSQIIMQSSGIMFLDNEPEAVGRPNLEVAGWLLGVLKIAFRLIGRNLAGHHASPASATILDRLHIRSHDKPVDERPYRLFLSEFINYRDRIGCNGFQNLRSGTSLGRIEKSFTRLPLGFEPEVERVN